MPRFSEYVWWINSDVLESALKQITDACVRESSGKKKSHTTHIKVKCGRERRKSPTYSYKIASRTQNFA